MKKAVHEVKKLKAGVRATAAKYNIDRSLLSRRLLNKCTGPREEGSFVGERTESSFKFENHGKMGLPTLTG